MEMEDFIKLLHTTEEQIAYHYSPLEQHMKRYEVHKTSLQNPSFSSNRKSCAILINIYYDIGPELCVLVMLATTRRNLEELNSDLDQLKTLWRAKDQPKELPRLIDTLMICEMFELHQNPHSLNGSNQISQDTQGILSSNTRS